MKNERRGFNKPPLFKGVRYDYWKQRMVAFFESCHIDMLDVVENGNNIPYYDNLNEPPRGRWNDEQKQRHLLNSKAMNSTMCPLSEEEYTKVHSFKSTKEIWDTLIISYEGFTKVKPNKIGLFTC